MRDEGERGMPCPELQRKVQVRKCESDQSNYWFLEYVCGFWSCPVRLLGEFLAQEEPIIDLGKPRIRSFRSSRGYRSDWNEGKSAISFSSKLWIELTYCWGNDGQQRHKGNHGNQTRHMCRDWRIETLKVEKTNYDVDWEVWEVCRSSSFAATSILPFFLQCRSGR